MADEAKPTADERAEGWRLTVLPESNRHHAIAFALARARSKPAAVRQAALEVGDIDSSKSIPLTDLFAKARIDALEEARYLVASIKMVDTSSTDPLQCAQDMLGAAARQIEELKSKSPDFATEAFASRVPWDDEPEKG